MSNPIHLYAVADYAIIYAVELATDAKMKGPLCDEFRGKMQEAIRLMTEAQTAMHMYCFHTEAEE